MSGLSQHDKRWSDRRNIGTDVKIIFSNRSYYARTQDIGLGGMFIDLNYVLIPKQTPIEVIMLQYKDNAGYVSFQAKVTYVTPHGYGLVFDNFGIQEVHQLQNILYESPYEVVRIA